MLEIGSEIEGYRIERLIGRGGMGEVYEATQLGLGRKVAFKVLHTRLGQDRAFRERFRREGQLQAGLEHPNVVTVYEAGELEGELFLAMRLVAGATLKQLIVSAELDAARALRVLQPIASALDAAHARGLVHRDVKPQNILVADQDHPFLADFGLTRGTDETGLTRSGQFVGTVDYISPEQVRGEPAVSASDVYAFAGVLYECLSGSVPYPRPSDAAVLYAHVNDDPPRVCATRPDLPDGIDRVIARGMAKEPERRPSATELIAAAAAELEGDPAVAGSRPPQTGSLAHGVRPVEGDTEDGIATPATPAAPATPATLSSAGTSGTGQGVWARTASVLSEPWARWAGVSFVVALAAVAFLAGRAGDGETPGELATAAASDTISLRAPAGWTAISSDERPAITGLDLADAVGVAPAARDASGVLAGVTSTSGPLLLPAGLRERLGDDTPTGDPVKLGDLEALRYEGLRLRGFDRGLTLYVAPTTAGVATVACYSPSSGAAAAGPVCESIAQSLELLRGRPFPLATEPDVARSLRRATAELNGSRKTGRRALARASTPDGQARAAQRLATAYDEGTSSLRELEVSPAIAAATANAERAMRAAAGAYRRLSAAARASSGSRFDAARAAIRKGEARVDRALSRLEDAVGGARR